MFNHTNKKLAVITGVTQGLGRAMVDRFDELGWTIAGCGRSEEKIKQLRSQFDSKHHFQTIDVSDEMAVSTWAKPDRILPSSTTFLSIFS